MLEQPTALDRWAPLGYVSMVGQGFHLRMTLLSNWVNLRGFRKGCRCLRNTVTSQFSWS